jgi:hypothetical protein
VKREYVRKDGTCLKCRKPRNPRKNPYSGIAPFLDPFCSSKCCKEFHEVPATTSPTTSAAPYAKQLPECGTTAAYHSGCKCDRCRAAEAAKQRERRAKKPDQYRAAEQRRKERKRQAMAEKAA